MRLKISSRLNFSDTAISWTLCTFSLLESPGLRPMLTPSQTRRGGILVCLQQESSTQPMLSMVTYPSMQKYRWQIQPFFLWDALLCILRTIAHVGFYSTLEPNRSWKKVADAYLNHEEFVKGWKLLFVTIGKLNLKAWLLNPPSESFLEPISSLRCVPNTNRK